MNAFATGATKSNSLVAVSTGLLNNMTEAEAEAVLAHEISHISNGDMVTMALLQGVLNTFVIFLSRVIATAVVSLRNNNGEETRSSGYLFLGFDGIGNALWCTCKYYRIVVLALLLMSLQLLVPQV